MAELVFSPGMTASQEQKPKKKRASRPKCKTGCGTCKIRHIRCDEQKPICTNCSSTGRICDGYLDKQTGTIYGGHKGQNEALPPPPKSPSDLVAFDDAAGFKAFQFFRLATTAQLTAALGDATWANSVLQFCHEIPAARHAAMALGSLSERFQLHEVSTTHFETDRLDRMALTHYLKSISQLAEHIKGQMESGQGSVPVQETIVTCLLLMLCEFLQGNPKGLLTHLICGTDIVQQHCQDLDAFGTEFGVWLQQMIQLMDMVAVLWLNLPRCPSRKPINFEALLMYGELKRKHVFNRLDRLEDSFVQLANRVLTMQQLVQSLRETGELAAAMPDAEAEYRSMRTELEMQKRELIEVGPAADQQPRSPGPIPHDMRGQMSQLRVDTLRMKHLVTEITLLGTFEIDKSAHYSRFKPSFETILNLARPHVCNMPHSTIVNGISLDNLSLSSPKQTQLRSPPATPPVKDKSSKLVPLFAFDDGIIRPLFFVATCAPGLDMRNEAISLLEENPWREGGWDAAAMARIARQNLAGNTGGIPLLAG